VFSLVVAFQVAGLFKISQEGEEKHPHSFISKNCRGSMLPDEVIMVFLTESSKYTTSGFCRRFV